MRTWSIFLAAAIAGQIVAAAQQRDPARVSRTAPAGRAAVSGVVVTDEPTPVPVRRAVVKIQGGANTATRGAITDDGGRFAVEDLPAGRYTVVVSKPGWPVSHYGARQSWRPPGIVLALGDGQRVADLTVKMARGAVITGRLSDSGGRPLASARLDLMQVRTIAGGRRLVSVNQNVSTDDRGDYRLYGIAPGTYVLAVLPWFSSLRDGDGFRITTADDLRQIDNPPSAAGGPADPVPVFKYAPTYYPGTIEPARAMLITVGASEERMGIDFAIARVGTTRMEGTVSTPDGTVLYPMEVTLRSVVADVEGPPVLLRASANTDGEFVFSSVSPGQYQLRATGASANVIAVRSEGLRPAGDDYGVVDNVTVTAAGPMTVRLTLQPTATIERRVVFEKQSPEKPDLEQFEARLIRADDAEAAMRVLSWNRLTVQDTFASSVLPGHYFFEARPQSTTSGWMLKSVTVDGIDVTLNGFDILPGETRKRMTITFTDRVSELTGTLTDALSRPAPEYFVLVFPADTSHWTERSGCMRPPVRPASDGRFSVTALPAGNYLIAALSSFDDLDYLDPGFLEQLRPVSLPVTIREGERTTQDIRLAGTP